MKDRLTTAPPPRTPEAQLERPPGLWNSPQGYWNAPWRIWNARRAILYCSLAGDIISVLIRSALRRSAPWNAQSAIGTAFGQWNAQSATGTTSGLLERPQGVSKKPLLHTRYTRNRGGNVEQSWCFRGERFSFRGPRKSRIFGESRGLGRPPIKWSGISHCDSSAECECKITTFF